MSKVKIFAYKGLIGIRIPVEIKGLVNDPNEVNGMMHIIDTKYIEFSKEAIELIGKLPKSDKCMADLLSYQVNISNRNTSEIKPKNLFGFKSYDKTKVIGRIRPTKKDSSKMTPVVLSKEFNHDILVASDIEPTETFKKYVDNMELEGTLNDFAIV